VQAIRRCREVQPLAGDRALDRQLLELPLGVEVESHLPVDACCRPDHGLQRLQRRQRGRECPAHWCRSSDSPGGRVGVAPHRQFAARAADLRGVDLEGRVDRIVLEGNVDIGARDAEGDFLGVPRAPGSGVEIALFAAQRQRAVEPGRGDDVPLAAQDERRAQRQLGAGHPRQGSQRNGVKRALAGYHAVDPAKAVDAHVAAGNAQAGLAHSYLTGAELQVCGGSVGRRGGRRRFRGRRA
jgi:hypothetical protein